MSTGMRNAREARVTDAGLTHVLDPETLPVENEVSAWFRGRRLSGGLQLGRFAVRPGHCLTYAGLASSAWVIAEQNGQYVADSWCLADGLGQRAVSLDLVAITAAVFMFDDVSGRSQVRDDAVRAALGDAQNGRDVPQSRVWILRDAQQDAGVIRQETPSLHNSNSIIKILERHC
jgi:hypothetical protein